MHNNPHTSSKTRNYDVRCFGGAFENNLDLPQLGQKTAQKPLSPSIDQVKSVKSEITGDFDFNENSFSADDNHNIHINTFKANCPSSHFVKSLNTVDTADTQFSANQSIR